MASYIAIKKRQILIFNIVQTSVTKLQAGNDYFPLHAAHVNLNSAHKQMVLELVLLHCNKTTQCFLI